MSVPRTVAKSFRHVLTPPKPRKANPWPKCRQCHSRNPPVETCGVCGCCTGCCLKCDQCSQCPQACTGHDR